MLTTDPGRYIFRGLARPNILNSEYNLMQEPAGLNTSAPHHTQFRMTMPVSQGRLQSLGQQLG